MDDQCEAPFNNDTSILSCRQWLLDTDLNSDLSRFLYIVGDGLWCIRQLGSCVTISNLVVGFNAKGFPKEQIIFWCARRIDWTRSEDKKLET